MNRNPVSKPEAERGQAELVIFMTKAQLAALLREVAHEAASNPQPEVLGLRDAAAFFGVHPRTLMKKLVRKRGCPVHYIGPQDPRFRRSELLAWLTKQAAEPQDEREGEDDD